MSDFKAKLKKVRLLLGARPQACWGSLHGRGRIKGWERKISKICATRCQRRDCWEGKDERLWKGRERKGCEGTEVKLNATVTTNHCLAWLYAANQLSSKVIGLQDQGISCRVQNEARTVVGVRSTETRRDCDNVPGFITDSCISACDWSTSPLLSPASW